MFRFSRPSGRLLPLVLAVPFIVAACADATADAPATEPPDSDATPVAAPDGLATDAASADTAAWLDVELTDAATGEVFTLASLSGEVVALEPMAIWCANCQHQQDNVRSVYDEVQDAGIRYISVGVDPNEDPKSLARYAERREYDWTFTQASTDFARQLADVFGPQILSPPSTPLILLDANGDVVVQTFGPHGPDELLEVLSEATA